MLFWRVILELFMFEMAPFLTALFTHSRQNKKLQVDIEVNLPIN